jgi:hypothetical protein
VHAEIPNGICLGIVAAVDVHSNKVVGEDTFKNAHVIVDNRLCPVRLGLPYVGSVGGVVIGGLDLRQGSEDQKKHNR